MTGMIEGFLGGGVEIFDFRIFFGKENFEM